MDYYAITHDMTQLGLKGSRLIVYALVYKFSSDGQSEFFGSLSYVSEWCAISRAQATQILHDLTAEGYLTRDDSSGRPRYRVASVRKSEHSENRTHCSEDRTPCSENRTPSDNRDYNKIINKDTHTSPRAREDNKTRYGDNVLLTEAEHDKLLRDYGTEDTARLIEILDLWLANQKKDPYKSHYAAIKKWCVRDLAEQKTVEQRLQNAKAAAGQRSVVGNVLPDTGAGARAMATARRLEELLNKK